MIAPMQLKQEIESNRIDYNALVWDKGYKAVISNDSRDINLFIPVRGRLKFFKPCINNILESAKNASTKVRIVIVENDIKPVYIDACRDANVDYVFIPVDSNRSLGLFEKSLCYNAGFLAVPKTEWSIFHDIDILVDKEYFKSVFKHLSRNPKWLQPYTKKRVRMLSNWATMLITDGTYDNTPEWLNDNSCPSKPGSPGGSIVVRSSDFEKIGGYDPEIFYGYSPEDAFFWVKLELLYGAPQGIIRNHFIGSASYADDPAIEVYHMEHSAASGSNSKYTHMLELLESFYIYDNRERMDIINLKKNMFLKV